jgi:hypothetical protein
MRRFPVFEVALASFLVATTALPAHAQPRRTPAAPSQNTGCTVSAAAPWLIPAKGNTPRTQLRVEAFANGPTCAKAVAVYVIRAPDGTVLHQESYIAENNAVTSEGTTPAQMRAALVRWTSFRNNDSFYDRLPNWVQNADGPEQREFGFIPDESLSRTDYLAIKAVRPPSICYVSGIESLTCLIYRGGRLEPFGVQPFPG